MITAHQLEVRVGARLLMENVSFRVGPAAASFKAPAKLARGHAFVWNVQAMKADGGAGPVSKNAWFRTSKKAKPTA